MKTIEKNYYNTKQAVNFEGLYDHKGHKLKVFIKKDSYDFQSKATISVWSTDELKWNNLASIPYSLMDSVKTDIFYLRKVEELHYKEKCAITNDVITLTNKAKKIL